MPPVPVKKPLDLEQLIGTRWAVLVGGLALALGGIFLVRYSIEQGLFGPGLRVICGLLLALALLGTGLLAAVATRRRRPAEIRRAA